MSADGVAGELPEALRARILEEMSRRVICLLGVEGDAGAVFVAEILRGNTNVEDLRLCNRGIGAVSPCAGRVAG